MSIPKHLKGRIALIALKEASDNFDKGDDDDFDDVAEEVDDEYTCPKCGHSGSKSEFKD